MEEFNLACNGEERPKCCSALAEQMALPPLCKDPNSKGGSSQLYGFDDV